VPAGITADLGGNPRVVNGEVDMGAYESQGYSLTISAGSAQSTTVGSTFAASLLVSVASNSGEPVGPGGTIYFTSPPGGAGLSAAYTATTDISGTALVTVAANTVAGSYAVTATAPGVVAPAIFTLTNTPASLHVIRTGTGHGRVNSQPAGIDCGPTCIAEFDYGQFVTLTATPDAGSAFDGWSGACNGVGVCQATVTRNLSVTATFALLTHTLTTAMAGNGSGSISLTPAGGTYDYGTVVTATATPGTGSSFAGWSGVCSGAGACVVAVTGDGALTATFTLNSHALATGTAGTGAGSISLNPAGGVYDYGTAVTLTATPDAGSLFTAWSGAISSASNPIVLVMDADRSVTATFALNTYVQFSAADFVVDEGAGSATVTITLNTASASPVSVDVATADHTAVAPDDYAVVSATLTYAPGETSQHIQVPIVDDALDEVNQSLTLTLRNPANAWLGSPASARLTILDDDGPLAAFTPPTYSVSESGGQVIITVSLSAASVQTVTLDYATCDGNAIGGHDYIAISGTLILAPGEQTATIRVAILDDETLLEPDETFTLVLDQSVNAVLGTPATATIVIVDNDVNPPPVEVSAPADPASPVTVSVNSPAGTAQITLDDVRSGGMITVLASVTPTDQPPGNFSLLGTSFYIANSGIDFGRATLRLPYRDSDVAAAGVLEQSLRLLHLENGQWIDITTGLDTDANIITGVTESFSPFVFGVQDMLNCAISLNSGARFTSRLGAQVFSNQPDAAEILLGNDAGFTGARWQPYVSALDWTMTDPGNRIVTLLVYARLRDVHGNPLCSGLSVIDDIIYDPLAPSLASIAIQSQASNALWSTAAAPISTTLRVTATDQQGGSGVAGLQISPRADLAGARWQPFSDLAQVTAQPGATLYARVRDGVGNVSNVASVRVPGGDPPSYSAPVVSLTASSPIWLGQPAVFTPSVSTTPPGDPTITYQWSFGDGVASTASNPGHTYTAAGAYTVVLTAINAAGSGVASATVTVYGAPRARFSAYPISGSAPLLVHFTNASTPNGDPTLSYYWSFGDGAVSQLQHPIHIYPAAGSFTAVLTVSNAAGASPAPASLVITVTPPITGSILITPGVASVLTFSAGYTAAIAFDARFADVPITLTYELTHAGGMTESPGQIGAAFVLLAYGPAGNPVTQFSRPFTITIGYADADVAGLNEAVLGLYFWDTQQLRWARIPGRVDIAANRLIAPVNRLARFAVIAQRKTMYLPMLQR
jgi:PKD repeat protein